MSETKNSGALRLDQLRFSAPPVRSVTIEVAFAVSRPLTLSLVGALVDRWQNEFPDVSELVPQPSESSNLGILTDGDTWPFPIITMTSETGASITLQANSLAVGWIFGPNSGESSYPGFVDLKARLSAFFSQLVEHLQSKSVVVSLRGASCRYVNDVPHYSPKELVAGYFTGWPTDKPVVAKDAVEPSYVGGRIFFEPTAESDGCSIMVGIDPPEEESRAGTLSVLDISSKFRASEPDKDATLESLDTVHEQLIKTFLAVSNKALRHTWGEQ